jgi:lipid II:glycine glycyltransferase (peptidoglycan interpeptide bridge formation enzyme)
MYKFEVINVNNPRWEKFVKSSAIYDFHHTSFYHKIDNNFTAFLFVAEYENDFIALPLVLRTIEQTLWFDLTSVYGYCGPISSRKYFDFDKLFLDFFQAKFMEYCKANNIVSVFSRLHPLIPHQSVFAGMGEVLNLNKTVMINLMLSREEQKRQYRKSNKSELSQLRRKGFYVLEGKTQEDVDSFVDIYTETMDRVNAQRNYYFTKEYFYSFLRNSHFDSKLLLAKYQDRIVAGAIFTYTDKIMQYHLAGTTEEFMKLTPMKLILDEAVLLGSNLNLEFLHLGGGVGGTDDDNLFKFKSGFSKSYCQFSVWRYISNDDIYNQLSLNKKKSSYFPLYRS